MEWLGFWIGLGIAWAGFFVGLGLSGCRTEPTKEKKQNILRE